MDNVYLTIGELKNEKQKEAFLYSLKLAEINKKYKKKLSDNNIISDKNFINKTHVRRYYKEIFNQSENIVEFFQNELKQQEKIENEREEKSKQKKVREKNWDVGDLIAHKTKEYIRRQ